MRRSVWQIPRAVGLGLRRVGPPPRATAQHDVSRGLARYRANLTVTPLEEPGPVTGANDAVSFTLLAWRLP